MRKAEDAADARNATKNIARSSPLS